VGRAAFELRPLIAAIGAHVLAAAKIHGDDTPVPVLAPGTGKTAIGRLPAPFNRSADALRRPV